MVVEEKKAKVERRVATGVANVCKKCTPCRPGPPLRIAFNFPCSLLVLCASSSSSTATTAWKTRLTSWYPSSRPCSRFFLVPPAVLFLSGLFILPRASRPSDNLFPILHSLTLPEILPRNDQKMGSMVRCPMSLQHRRQKRALPQVSSLKHQILLPVRLLLLREARRIFHQLLRMLHINRLCLRPKYYHWISHRQKLR